MNKQLLVLLISLLVALPCWAKLTPEQEEAKQKGILFFNQSRPNENIEKLLLIAAEAGDVEAMVYLGIVMKITNPSISNKWLEKAASQGDIYAMYQLNIEDIIRNQYELPSRNNNIWRKKGTELSLAKAQQGDPESMYIYYKFTRDINWLKKAADADWADAQEDMAYQINLRTPLFNKLTREEQKKLFVEYLEKAQANGSLGALEALVYYYSSVYSETPPVDPVKAKAYFFKALEKNYLPAIRIYISALNGSKEYQKLGITKDLIKAYALTSILVDANAIYKYSLIYYTEGYHPNPLNPYQISKAEAFKEQWIKTHPPLTNAYNKLIDVNAKNQY